MIVMIFVEEIYQNVLTSRGSIPQKPVSHRLLVLPGEYRIAGNFGGS